MQKETKSNLIFLIILLIVMIPGGVILVRKKLDPTSSKMGEPDPVRRSTAYVDPFEFPDDFRRLVPPGTEDWVATLVPTHLARPPATAPSDNGKPVVSEQRMFEVLSFTRNSTGIKASVLVWHLPGNKPPTLVKAKAAAGKQVLDAMEVKIVPVEIPASVRKELRLSGYIRPPSQAAIVTAQFSDLPDPTSRKPIELMIQVFADDQTKYDLVRIFTNPVYAIQ